MPLSEQKLLGGRFWGLSGPGPALGSWPPPPGSLSSLTCCFVIAYSELELVRAAWRGREGALSWVWQAVELGAAGAPTGSPIPSGTVPMGGAAQASLFVPGAAHCPAA